MSNFNWLNTEWMPRMNYGIIHTGQPWMWYDASQVWCDGNELALHIEKKPKTIIYDGKEYHPQLAVGTVKSVQSYGYGTFSAEIQLPKGKNLWPAFWLVGEERWPKGGEIDICEAWTNRFGGYFKMGIPQPPYLVPSWNTTTNVHWGKDKEHHESCGSRRLPIIFSLKRPARNYIKYEVEWRQDIITFRANGHRVRTYGYHVAKHLHDKQMNVIFDLWTTGEDFSCETPMKIRNFEYKPIETL